ncbi:MAG: 5'-nucleotidase C-terminal domain-containing protein, partial [Gammaproteobacteria bacterium]
PYPHLADNMVRLGGMNYVCDPNESIGKRITDMTLNNGEKIEASKVYKVSGWATVGSISPGPAVWDVVADYIRDHKNIKINSLNSPKLINIDENPGIS